MHHLLVYGTVEGQTRKIAERISELLFAKGDDVSMHDIADASEHFTVSDFDSCIVAAPVHQKRYPEDINNFVRAHVADLNKARSAFVSVSLAAAFDDGSVQAQTYVDELVERTGWSPTAVHNAAGALRYTEYDFFQEQIIRHIVLQGRDTEDIHGDHEFTDWQALERFVDAFQSQNASA